MRIVTFNLQHANRLDRALEIMRSEPGLAGADVISLQEADDRAVSTIAEALGMQSAWYPAAIHPHTGRPFAPAVLSRWPIASHQTARPSAPRTARPPRVAVHAHIRPPGGSRVRIRRGALRHHAGDPVPASGRPGPRRPERHRRTCPRSPGRRGRPQPPGSRVGLRGAGIPLDHPGHRPDPSHLVVRSRVRPGFAANAVRTGSVRAALQASDHRAVWAELDHD